MVLEPLSMTATIVGLVGTVGKASAAIAYFASRYRDAYQDMDTLHSELGGLKLNLEILKEDTAEGKSLNLPEKLSKHIMSMLYECDSVIVQIMEKLSKYTGNGVVAKTQWAMGGREDMNKLRSSLAAHSGALGIALEVVTMLSTITRDIKKDTTVIKNETGAIKQDTAEILAKLASLQRESLPGRGQFHATAIFGRFDNYAETSYQESIPDQGNVAWPGDEDGLGSEVPGSDVQEPNVNAANDPSRPHEAVKNSNLNTRSEEMAIKPTISRPQSTESRASSVGHFPPSPTKYRSASADKNVDMMPNVSPLSEYRPPLPPRPSRDTPYSNSYSRSPSTIPSPTALGLEFSSRTFGKSKMSLNEGSHPGIGPGWDNLPLSAQPSRTALGSAPTGFPLLPDEAAISMASIHRSRVSGDRALELDIKLRLFRNSLPGRLKIFTKTAQVKDIQKLLESGADPNKDLRESSQAHTILSKLGPEERKMVQEYAIFTAVERGYIEALELLLKFGANQCIFREKESKNEMPLHAAVRYGNPAAVSLLLRYGADVDATSDEGTALCIAAAHCNAHTVEIIRLLLDFGADVNAKGSSARTPLLHALKARSHSPHPVGAGNEAYTIDRYNSDMVGMLSRLPRVVKVLLDAGADVNISTSHTPQECSPSLHPLTAAAALQICLAAGLQAASGLSALSQARERTSYEITKMLLEKGAEVDAPYMSEHIHICPLLEASFVGYSSTVKFLLQHDANPNWVATQALQYNHSLPLYAAVSHRNREVVNLLLDAGANVNLMPYPDSLRGTILHSAVGALAEAGPGADFGRGCDIVRLLVQHGAETGATASFLYQKSEWGRSISKTEEVTPLILAQKMQLKAGASQRISLIWALTSSDSRWRSIIGGWIPK